VEVARMIKGSRTIERLLFEEAADETMEQVFGEVGAKVFYDYVEE